jgi:hypothetical protein
MIYHSCDKSVFCFIFPWRRICVFVLLYRQWFVDRCLSFCSFSFCHGIVCPVNNDFWLPIWYIHTFLVPLHNNTIHIYYRWFVLWMWINHVKVTLFYECGSIMSTSHCAMNVDQSCQSHIVLWMWINHVNVTLFYECGSIMSKSHCSMNMDQSCQRHIVLWMWINHINVTLFYECGSIMLTSQFSMNVDQSCQRHIVLWMCINHVNVTSKVKFVMWDAMKRPFQAKHIDDRTCIENLETWQRKRHYDVTWENS